MNASDILEFNRVGSRSENDKLNRIREKCMMILNEKNHQYFQDPTFGNQWLSLQRGFEDFIKSQLTEIGKGNQEIKTYTLKRFGNLQNHYDFIVNINLEDNFVFEFKFRSMPQFVNIFDKDRYIPQTLPEYWYDKGILDTIISLYPQLTIAKPSREEYIKGVTQLLGRKSKKSFFKQFYEFDHEGEFKEGSDIYRKKLEICHEGIKHYLELQGNLFDVERFKNMLLKDQPQKIYGIWNPEKQEFTRIQYTKEMLTPTKIKSIRQGSKIMLETLDPRYEIECYLRWKNCQGICNPAWQVSMKLVG